VARVAGAQKIDWNLLTNERLVQPIRGSSRGARKHDDQRFKLVSRQPGNELDQLPLGAAVVKRRNAECDPYGQE
jgi:hypothetical protein